MFAYIYANNLTERYLQFELDKWNENSNSNIKFSLNNELLDDLTPEWKETKTAFVEMLYLFHSSGGFGDADINSILRGFQKGFKIEVRDPYKIYNELRLRDNKTKFIDSAKDKFIKRMKDDESNWKNYS